MSEEKHMFSQAIKGLATKHIGSEQALRGTLVAGGGWGGGGGLRKERLQLHLIIIITFNIWVEKVNAKCWLAEMTLVMCLQLARAPTCFLMFVYIRTQIISPLHWLAEIWQLSRRGNWRPNSNSREIVARSPSFSRPTAWVPRRACSEATKTLISTQIGGFHAISGDKK